MSWVRIYVTTYIYIYIFDLDRGMSTGLYTKKLQLYNKIEVSQGKHYRQSMQICGAIHAAYSYTRDFHIYTNFRLFISYSSRRREDFSSWSTKEC